MGLTGYIACAVGAMMIGIVTFFMVKLGIQKRKTAVMEKALKAFQDENVKVSVEKVVAEKNYQVAQNIASQAVENARSQVELATHRSQLEAQASSISSMDDAKKVASAQIDALKNLMAKYGR